MLVLLGALLAGTSPAGCIAKGADDATFASKMTVRHDIAPISHLLVALTGGLDDDWRQGIQSGLARQLRSCGIRSTMMWPIGLELDFLGRARRAAQQTRVSAILTIECKRSSAVDVNYETRKQLTFELILIEPRSGKVVWLVESKLALESKFNTSDKATAERFAASIVSQLQADGVLRTCPEQRRARPARATWNRGTSDARGSPANPVHSTTRSAGPAADVTARVHVAQPAPCRGRSSNHGGPRCTGV